MLGTAALGAHIPPAFCGPPSECCLCEKLGSGGNHSVHSEGHSSQTCSLRKARHTTDFQVTGCLTLPWPTSPPKESMTETQGASQQGTLVQQLAFQSAGLDFSQNVPASPGLTTSPVEKVLSKCRNLRPPHPAFSLPLTATSERTGTLLACSPLSQPSQCLAHSRP